MKDDPQLPGGAPDILYPKYLEAIKGSKRIVAKPGQVIQIGSMSRDLITLVMGAGVGLGILGSWVSVRTYLIR